MRVLSDVSQCAEGISQIDRNKQKESTQEEAMKIYKKHFKDINDFCAAVKMLLLPGGGAQQLRLKGAALIDF